MAAWGLKRRARAPEPPSPEPLRSRARAPGPDFSTLTPEPRAVRRHQLRVLAHVQNSA